MLFFPQGFLPDNDPLSQIPNPAFRVGNCVFTSHGFALLDFQFFLRSFVSGYWLLCFWLLADVV